MDYSPAFEWLCSELEQRTRFARIEARGTVRLVLKDAGLEPRSVTAAQRGRGGVRPLPRHAAQARGVGHGPQRARLATSDLLVEPARAGAAEMIAGERTLTAACPDPRFAKWRTRAHKTDARGNDPNVTA